jgi:hypothetical protein
MLPAPAIRVHQRSLLRCYQINHTCLLQVCGFIALYLHLAEISWRTCLYQPEYEFHISVRDKWRQLIPHTMIAGLSMWLAMVLHQQWCAMTAELTPSTPQIAEQHAGGLCATLITAVATLDGMGYELYRSAHQLLMRIADNSVGRTGEGFSTAAPLIAQSRLLVSQLGQLVSIAQTVVLPQISTAPPAPCSLSAALQQACDILSARQQLQHIDIRGSLEDWCSLPDMNMKAATFNAAALAQVTAGIRSLHPALQRGDGMDWCAQRRYAEYHMPRGINSDKARGKERLRALDFPTPLSLLRAFPPAPSDLQQWATFYHNACPVSPYVPSRALRWGLSEPQKIELPQHPAEGASSGQVAAHVTAVQALLGPYLYAQAPVAAAILQRPYPWVGPTFALHHCCPLALHLHVLSLQHGVWNRTRWYSNSSETFGDRYQETQPVIMPCPAG